MCLVQGPLKLLTHPNWLELQVEMLKVWWKGLEGKVVVLQPQGSKVLLEGTGKGGKKNDKQIGCPGTMTIYSTDGRHQKGGTFWQKQLLVLQPLALECMEGQGKGRNLFNLPDEESARIKKFLKTSCWIRRQKLLNTSCWIRGRFAESDFFLFKYYRISTRVAL